LIEILQFSLTFLLKHSIRRPPYGPVLGIGAAFDVATIPALAKGDFVFANDLDNAHLEEPVKRVLDTFHTRLLLR